MSQKETVLDIAKKVISLNDEAKFKERMGLFTRLHLTAGAISLVWMFYAIQYLITSGWWSNRFAMSPPEFVGFISGMVLPLVLIWLVVAYIDRSRQFQRDSQALQKYMEQLVSPTEEGTEYTKALTDTLRVYVKEFKDVFQDVSSSTCVIASDLKDRITELKHIQGEFKGETKSAVEDLSSHAQGIVEAAVLATENAKDTTENLRWQIDNLHSATEQSNTIAHNLGVAVQEYTEKFQTVSDTLSTQTSDLADNLNGRVEMLYKASELTKDSLVHFSTSISEQVSVIEETTDRVKSRTDNIGVIVDEKAHRLEQIFQKQKQGLDDMTQKIDEKASVIDDSLKAQSELLDSELDKVVSRFRLIEDGLAIQTGEIVNASDKIIDDLNEMYGKFDEHKKGLLDATIEASEKIQEVSEVYDVKAEKLNASVLEIDSNISNVSQKFEDRLHSYNALADGLGERLTSINVTTGKQLSSLKDIIETVNSSISAVKEDIKNQSEDLSDLINIIDSQGKMAEASLSQQQRSISTTGVKIEEIKNDLKSHIEELESFYDRLDSNANSYLKKTRAGITEASLGMESLVKHTTTLNASIDSELGKIQDTNALTVSTSEKVTSELDKHNLMMAEIIQSMQSRTNDIYKLFTSQKSVIEGSAKEIQTKVGKISTDFENSMALLMRNAHDAIGEVSDISKELQMRAEDIDGLFTKQDTMLNVSSEKLNESANRILDIVRSNSTQLDNDLDRIRSRVFLIEDSFSTQINDLLKASEDSLNKLSALSGELIKQSDNVMSISKVSQDNVNEIISGLVEQSKHLISVIEEVASQGISSGTHIESKSKQLEQTMVSFTEKSQAVAVVLSEHIDMLDRGGQKTQNQAQSIRNTLNQQIEELVDVSNTLSTNTRLSEAAIVSQYTTLKQTSDKASENIKEIGGLFKQSTSDILSNVSRVNKELDFVGSNVKDKSEAAHKIVEETIKNTKTAAQSLDEQYKTLESMSEKAIISISSVVGQLKNNALSVSGASDTSMEKINAVSDTLAMQKLHMDKVTEEVTTSVRQFAQNIKEKSDEFNSTTDNIENKVAGLIESITTVAKEFEDISNDSVAKVDVTSSHLRSTITEVASNSSRIASDVKEASSEFLKQSEALNNSASTAISKLENLLIAMQTNSTEVEEVNDKLSASALKVGGALSRHVQALISASNTAEEQVKKMDKKALEVSHDNFLKEASFIIEKLQAVAVDITRIFQPNVEEELWKKYYNGDRSAFMRYLIKALDKHQVSSIRKLFENDTDFRDYVSGYMSNFEAVLDRAKLSDRSDVIIAILTGSDVGRLYMILARSLSNKD